MSKIAKGDKQEVVVIAAAVALHAIVASGGARPSATASNVDDAVNRAFELADKFVAAAERRGVFED